MIQTQTTKNVYVHTHDSNSYPKERICTYIGFKLKPQRTYMYIHRILTQTTKNVYAHTHDSNPNHKERICTYT